MLDALLELKKQRLLFSVQRVEAETSQKAELTDGESVREKEDTEREGKSSDDMDDLQGVKCQAPMEEVRTQFKVCTLHICMKYRVQFTVMGGSELP